MKQKFFFSILLSILSISLFAQTTQLRVGLLNGPTCVPAAYLMENHTEISYEQFADPQTLLPKMIKKEIDIGFMPVNVAAKVYNAGNKAIICCAVTGLGNLSLITTDETIKRFTELEEKTVYVAGQGATPEYMMRFLLKENKVNNLTLDFSIPTAQIAAQLISGKITYAVVPEPFATIAQIKSEKVRSALNFQDEYMAWTGSTDIYPLSVMIVRTEFAKENPEVLEQFLNEYKKAVEWTIQNPLEAGKLTQKHNLGLSAEIVEKAVPVSNYTYIPAKTAKKSIEELLKLFLENDKSSLGGKLPDGKFYYADIK